jgi:hypothetical protein
MCGVFVCLLRLCSGSDAFPRFPRRYIRSEQSQLTGVIYLGINLFASVCSRQLFDTSGFQRRAECYDIYESTVISNTCATGSPRNICVHISICGCGSKFNSGLNRLLKMRCNMCVLVSPRCVIICIHIERDILISIYICV